MCLIVHVSCWDCCCMLSEHACLDIELLGTSLTDRVCVFLGSCHFGNVGRLWHRWFMSMLPKPGPKFIQFARGIPETKVSSVWFGLHLKVLIALVAISDLQIYTCSLISFNVDCPLGIADDVELILPLEWWTLPLPWYVFRCFQCQPHVDMTSELCSLSQVDMVDFAMVSPKHWWKPLPFVQETCPVQCCSLRLGVWQVWWQACLCFCDFTLHHEWCAGSISMTSTALKAFCPDLGAIVHQCEIVWLSIGPTQDSFVCCVDALPRMPLTLGTRLSELVHRFKSHQHADVSQ